MTLHANYIQYFIQYFHILSFIHPEEFCKRLIRHMLNNFMAGIFYLTFRYVFFMSKPTQTFVISVNRHRKTFPRLMF